MLRITWTAVCLAALLGRADAGQSSYVYRLDAKLSRDSDAVASEAKEGIKALLREFNAGLGAGATGAKSLWSYRTGRDMIYLFCAPSECPTASDVRKVKGVISAEIGRLMRIDGELAVCRISFDLNVRLRKGTTAAGVAASQLQAIKDACGGGVRLHYDRDTSVKKDGKKEYARGKVRAYMLLPAGSSWPTRSGVANLVVDRVKSIER